MTEQTPAPTPPDQLRLGVIVASTRPHRFADTVASWLLAQVNEGEGWQLDVMDLREIGAATDSKDFAARVNAADAFVIVVPEYNHGYPAPLKVAIDELYEEWQAKPVAFVSYGGASGGIRAAEQLRLVLAELHMVDIRDGVSFHHAYKNFDSSGQPIHADEAARAAQKMLQRLDWWARALRSAKKSSPYAA